MMKQLSLLDFDDERITLRDGVVNIDGVQVRGSRSCVRDPRKASPTLEMLERLERIAWMPHIKPVPKDKKWCSECAEWLSLNQFHKNISRRDGYCYVCAECERKRKRREYQNTVNHTVRHYKRVS